MLIKSNYLLITLFLYLTLIHNVLCCKSTTLTIWKALGFGPDMSIGGYLEARLHVKGEGTREFTGKDMKFFRREELSTYKNMFSKDKKFGLHGSYDKRDLTYTWKGKEQYLEKPVSEEVEREDPKFKGKIKYIYYGCI
ncbi:unnamed protein product [Cunninghamella blakesleeana]